MTKDPIELIKFCDPFKGESFEGYIARVAKVNYYQKVTSLYQLAGLFKGRNIQSINKCTPEQLSLINLSKATGISEQDLWNLTYYNQLSNNSSQSINAVILNFVNKRALHSRKEKKYCPECLKERLYFRKEWELVIYHVCYKHKSILISECPVCNRKVDNSKIPFDKCVCGFEYINSIPYRVENEYGELERAIKYKLEGTSNGSLPNNILLNFEFPIFVYLVMNFARYITSEEAHFNSNIVTYKDLALAYKAFNNWPVGFHEYINFYKTNDKKKKKDNTFFGLREYGILAQNVFNSYGPLGLDFIVNELEEYLLKNAEYIPYNNNNHSSPAKWISFMQFYREILKTNESIARRLISEGKIESKVVKRNSNNLTLVNLESVMKYKEELKKEIPYKEAYEKLDITYLMFKSLIDGEIFKESNYSGLKVNKFITKDSYDKFLEEIWNRTKLIDNINDSQYVGLVQVSKALGNHNITFIDIIMGILNKELIPYRERFASKNSIRALYLLRSDVEKFLDSQEFYIKAQLARKLQVDSRTIDDWIKEGLLRCYKDGRFMKILKKDFAEFKENYITLKEISLLTGDTIRALVNLLENKKTFPLNRNTNLEANSVYLYNRKEIELFLTSYKMLEFKLEEKEELRIPEIVSLLKINKGDLYKIIKNGFLKASKIKREYYIPKNEVEEFKSKYITLNEIELLFNMNTIKAKKYLSDKDIQPVTSPNINDIKKILFLREEILILIKNKKVQ